MTEWIRTLPPSVAAGVLLAGCLGSSSIREQVFPAMNTVVSIQVPRGIEDELPVAAHLAKTTLDQTYASLAYHLPDGELARLNRAAARVRVPVRPDTYRILSLCRRYAEMTGGAFDITVAPVLQLWGFLGGVLPANPPEQALIDTVLPGIGYEHLVTEAGSSIRFNHPHTRVALAGMLPCYALDLAVRRVRARGVHRARINVGGSLVRCIGVSQEDEPWQTDLLHPADKESLLGRVSLRPGQAMVVLGLYDNFVTLDGQRYGHIVDPRTGHPVSGTIGAAVLAPTATKGYALAVAALVEGVEGAPALLETFSRCDLLVATDEALPRLWMSPGFAQAVDLDEAAATDFRLFPTAAPSTGPLLQLRVPRHVARTGLVRKGRKENRRN